MKDPSKKKSPLADNTKRLLGLHAMKATSDSRAVGGLSPQLLSELQSGARERPSLSTLTLLSEFFEVSRDRLLDASFEQMLGVEIADADRYERVETKIAAWRQKNAPKGKSRRPR